MASALAEHPEPAFQHALRQFGARLFEAAPGLVTWVMLLAPAWIPILFKTPGALLVASAVLVFDLGRWWASCDQHRTYPERRCYRRSMGRRARLKPLYAATASLNRSLTAPTVRNLRDGRPGHRYSGNESPNIGLPLLDCS